MGLRFRRTVSILPGVRLNFSASGVSASVGPRGASLTIGPRGVYANAGLPGTGISMRTRLDSAPRAARRSSARSGYRDIMRLQREDERQQERLSAVEAHALALARVEKLQAILRDRVTAPYDWEAHWGPVPAPVTCPFIPAVFAPDARSIAKEAARRRPLWPWFALASAGSAFAALRSDRVELVIVGASMSILGALAAGAMVPARRRLRSTLVERARVEHEEAVSRARAEHEGDEARAHDAWREECDRRNRMATALRAGDPSMLADLLEHELANEDLPIPLVFEIEFEGVASVSIELVLPGDDTVPDERTELTKTGRLSVRPMSRRARTEMHGQLCSALALRLVHEAFRVLPMLRRIELLGTVDSIDPATGHDREYVALHLATEREAFEKLDLDHVDAHAALLGLRGVFEHDRSGVPKEIVGLQGLADDES